MLGRLPIATLNVYYLFQKLNSERQLHNLGVNTESAAGEMLTVSKVDSVNTFDAPNTLVPKPVSAKAQYGKLTFKLEPKSVTVIVVDQ